MLTLPIKGKWFDMILAGEKRERDILSSVYTNLHHSSVIQRRIQII